MRIVCPNCDTAYDVPESVVTPGRQMRCAQCRSEWLPGGPAEPVVELPPPPPPIAPEAEPDHVAAPEPPVMLAPPAPPAQPELVIHAPFPAIIRVEEPPRRAIMVAWVASLLALVALIWMAIAFRAPVMRHWPASARAYAALGYK
jgi:predicted Zn finger-like uncharacterized protein